MSVVIKCIFFAVSYFEIPFINTLAVFKFDLLQAFATTACLIGSLLWGFQKLLFNRWIHSSHVGFFSIINLSLGFDETGYSYINLYKREGYKDKKIW